MIDFNDFNIYRYEVGTIINNNRSTIIVTNDLETAENYYEANINKFNNNKDHVILFIYDYDKNTNVKYYDSKVDI